MSPDAMTPELVQQFVLRAHFDLETVQRLLAEHPALLNRAHEWGPGDVEDALGAAAHTGRRPIAEFLLAQGAPLTICAAAMLGQRETVAAMLAADPAQANARGAHGIPLLFHAAMSGDTALTDLLYAAGCREGFNFALHGAVAHGRAEMVDWLLAHDADDLSVRNHEGKTPLEKAEALGHTAIAERLRKAGG